MKNMGIFSNSQPSQDLPHAHTSMVVISGVGAHSSLHGPYVMMKYTIFMYKESQSFKI